MQKLIFITIGVGALLVIGAWFFLYACQADWCRIAPINLKPAVGPISQQKQIGRMEKHTAGPPLSIRDGFSISTFATNLPGARVIAFDAYGNMWVSLTNEGKIMALEIDRETKQVTRVRTAFENLRRPHGLVFDPKDPLMLYYAEEHQVTRIPTYREGSGEKVLDLPAGEGHYTRTLGFGSDGNLYISTGSSCNVCIEADERRSTIIQYDPTTAVSKIYARGLRNAVFFVWDSIGRIWATEMGRDLLGDDTPPDEINIIANHSPGDSEDNPPHYGWPICYGKNIHDTQFDKSTYIRNPCTEPFEIPSFIDIQAHAAPLGLAFVPENSGWPEEYRNDLIVAYHGSWNRSAPTGYKIVRHTFDEKGNYTGEKDFIAGFLQSDGSALGRPVDAVFDSDGTLYISDDKAGAIYRVEYEKIL